MRYKTKRKIITAINLTIAVIFLLALLWGIMFATDCSKTRKLKPPVFAAETKTTAIPGVIQYNGLGYTIKFYESYFSTDTLPEYDCYEIILYGGRTYRKQLIIY